VEKVIHYIRHNFWPLRSFTDLFDLSGSGRALRDTIANVRVHGTTGQRPIERFQAQALRPLPEFLPDCRDHRPCKGLLRFSIRFDAKSYTCPLGPSANSVIVQSRPPHPLRLSQDKVIATHSRFL